MITMLTPYMRRRLPVNKEDKDTWRYFNVRAQMLF